jgi:hypothetical protein
MWGSRTGRQRSQVRPAWWQEWQDEVMDGFLVKPQNQGRAGTTWEPSHEWRLAEATPSLRSFRWFTRKPLGSLVDPQSQGRRTEDGVAVAPDRSDRWVWLVWPVVTGLTGEVSDWSDRWLPVWSMRCTSLTSVRRRSPETSKWRTRVGIARLASRLSKFVVVGHLSDGAMTKIFQFALEGHVDLIS